MGAQILIIEDDDILASEIVEELSGRGYCVTRSIGGDDGMARALSSQFNAITLDTMLPGIDSLAIVATMRHAGVNTPVLMIGALSDLDERVRGLRAGGDDYLTKPFALEEMVARMEVLLRRDTQSTSAGGILLRANGLVLDLIIRDAYCGGRPLKLLPTEFRLLELFMRHPGQRLTRTMIFQKVWDMHFEPATNLIDVHVARLRRKLYTAGSEVQIRTLRSAGYALVETPRY
jgi:two-component system OmpR family response regulator